MQKEDVLARFQKAVNSAIIGNLLIAVIIFPYLGLLRTFLLVGALVLISWSFLAYCHAIHERIEFIKEEQQKDEKSEEKKGERTKSSGINIDKANKVNDE